MLPDLEEFENALASAHEKATAFLLALESRPPAMVVEAIEETRLSDKGSGAVAALDELWSRYGALFSGSSGPRYWGFVHGGLTAAALAADWISTTVDQTGQMHGDSPSIFVERDAIGMLRELFGLPDGYTGNFVSGGTMANAVCLATGLQALGAARGVNVSKDGVAALGRVRILSGEHHSSIAQAAAMLSIGRDSIERIPLLQGREAVDVAAMTERLEQLEDTPVIIVGNAGTVTTGDFDDLEALGRLAERHAAHFHVDGAFGLFAALSSRHAHLLKGLDHAGTIASDAHKWLNVPYDSGFVFTRHLDHQIEIFKSPSAYLPPTQVDPLAFQNMSPENSRRLRALPAWATLRAYGRSGYRQIVERCCGLAERFAQRIQHEPDFQLITPVRLNVTCFQLRVGGTPATLDETRAFVDRLKKDGRIFLSPSVLNGQACLRAAFVNWRTEESDLDIAIQALRACARGN